MDNSTDSPHENAWRPRDDHPNRKRSGKSAEVIVRVMKFMDESSISQSDLAKRTGLSKQRISKIIHGRDNLSSETISKLEDALGISLQGS